MDNSDHPDFWLNTRTCGCGKVEKSYNQGDLHICNECFSKLNESVQDQVTQII